MSWLTAALIGAGYILISQGLVFPVLLRVAGLLDLTGWLKQVLG